MQKVTIYKITVTKAFMMANTGEFASLTPWEGDTAFSEGYDDGGQVYELPEGYELDEFFDSMSVRAACGEMAIWQIETGINCSLRMIHGVPQIATPFGEFTELKKIG